MQFLKNLKKHFVQEIEIPLTLSLTATSFIQCKQIIKTVVLSEKNIEGDE